MKRKFNTAIAFTDMLFNILMGFFMLLMIALMIINPEKKKKDEISPVEIKSNVMVEIEWPGNFLSDVDLFVQLPNNEIVYFSNKDIPGAQLDRDDRGTLTDKLRMPDGSYQIIRENWEHVFITKPIPGWYTVNIVMFSMKDRGRVPVKVKVQKFKPYKLILHKREFLTYTKEEITQIRFKLDAKGMVVKTNNNFKSLLRQTEPQYP